MPIIPPPPFPPAVTKLHKVSSLQRDHFSAQSLLSMFSPEFSVVLREWPHQTNSSVSPCLSYLRLSQEIPVCVLCLHISCSLPDSHDAASALGYPLFDLRAASRVGGCKTWRSDCGDLLHEVSRDGLLSYLKDQPPGQNVMSRRLLFLVFWKNIDAHAVGSLSFGFLSLPSSSAPVDLELQEAETKWPLKQRVGTPVVLDAHFKQQLQACPPFISVTVGYTLASSSSKQPLLACYSSVNVTVARLLVQLVAS